MAGNGIANGALAALLVVHGGLLAMGAARAQGTVPAPLPTQATAPARPPSLPPAQESSQASSQGPAADEPVTRARSR